MSSSASAFLVVGITVSALALLSFGQQPHPPLALSTIALMRFFLLVFAISVFGLYQKTYRETSHAYSHIEEEQRTTGELESWLLANYAPEQIDLEIPGATRHPLRAEALIPRRSDFIQGHFLQHYGGMDEGYIEALSEEPYRKLFEGGHYGKAVLKKADVAVSEEQRNETAPQNVAPQDMAQVSEEMQPVDAMQSVEIPETAAYSTKPQTMAPENKADAYNTAPLDTAQENEVVVYNAEPQGTAQENETIAHSAESQTIEQAEAIPNEHEAEAADNIKMPSAVVSATEDTTAASAKTKAAAHDKASVKQS